jgi:prepilin-type N-terminal cleavage/methylation domain-containing protein
MRHHGEDAPRKPGRSQRGLNLVEVIVALALLAMVLMGISTLFIKGGKSVKSGKLLTSATSVGTDIMEEIDKMAYAQTYGLFGGTSAQTGLTADTRTNTYAQRWQANIDSLLSKPGYRAFATIVETPLGGGATFGTAECIRVAVTVQWQEGTTRVRTANFETVRF